MMSQGDKLKFFRILSGLNQNDISLSVGVAQSHVAKIENNKFAPARELLSAYCRLLGISGDYITDPARLLYPDRHFGIYFFPSKSILSYVDTAPSNRKINELIKVFTDMFPVILMEQKIKTYFLLHNSNNDHLLYIFPIFKHNNFIKHDRDVKTENFIIICTNNTYGSAIDKCIDSLLEKQAETVVDYDFSFGSDDMEIIEVAKSYFNDKESIFYIPEHFVEKWKRTRNISNFNKVLLKDNFIGSVDYSELYKVFDNGSYFEMLMLVPRFSLGRIVKETILEIPVYAIAIRNHDKNIYIFRRNSKNNFFVGDKSLQIDLNTKIAQSGKRIIHSVIDIGIPLYEKIKNWTVSKADIDPLFAGNFITFDENELISYLRENNIDSIDVIEILKTKKWY